jgi:hypothetical protein
MLHYYRKHEGILAWAVLALILRSYMWLTGMREHNEIVGPLASKVEGKRR